LEVIEKNGANCFAKRRPICEQGEKDLMALRKVALAAF
jgi:hypothetical protein